jgi:dTDP-4-amino-4,6-dideoxygalactose transaminase
VQAFANENTITVPRPLARARSAWHLFVVGVRDRDRDVEGLAREGIETLVHYPVLPHLSAPFRERGWQPGSFPVAERLADAALSLPLYPQLSRSQCEAVAAAVCDLGWLDA